MPISLFRSLPSLMVMCNGDFEGEVHGVMLKVHFLFVPRKLTQLMTFEAERRCFEA